MTYEMQKNILTQNEKKIMDLFWNSEVPLTSVDIVNLTKDLNWKHSYILSSLRSIQQKGLLEVCGSVRYATQYARQFCPAVSREEYAARLALTSGINKNSIADVTVALVRETCDKEELFDALENLIKERENKNG